MGEGCIRKISPCQGIDRTGIARASGFGCSNHFSDVAEFAAAPGQALPEGTPATDVFDRLGSGRTLLIVGEPGSGKTIALLKLAADAIDRTASDVRQQIPVVFNLSSWARKPQSIEALADSGVVGKVSGIESSGENLG